MEKQVPRARGDGKVRGVVSSASRTKRSDATRTLLLDTAERLFAERGYEGTGVRQIAELAGVNLGAIHYYWGSKQALCRDALERRLAPILKERAERIEDVAKGNAALTDLLNASHRPSLLAGGASAENAQSFRRFYGRMLFDPSPDVQAILASFLDPFAKRFVGLLKDRCSDLSDDEFYWRVTFMYGAFLYAHTTHTRTTALWGTRFNRTDYAAASDYLTRFLEGGLLAPPVSVRTPSRLGKQQRNGKKTK